MITPRSLLRRRNLVRIAAVAVAGVSLAAVDTYSPDLDHPMRVAGMARAEYHEPPSTEGDFEDFEHVANIDLSVFQEMGREENGGPHGREIGMGTFLDIVSFEVADEGLRDVAILGTDYDGTFLIDVTDPTAPAVRGHIPCRYEQNEARFVHGLDRPVVAIGRQAGPSCVPEDAEVVVHDVELGPFAGTILGGGEERDELVTIWDLSDLDDPTFLAAYDDSQTKGVHTMVAHPSEPVIVPVGGSQARLVFVDLSDPTNPTPLSAIDTPGTTHAAHFSADGTKLATAGGLVEALTVVDTTNLANPVIETVAATPSQTYAHEVHPFTQVDAVTGIERQFHIATEENLAGPFAGYCSSTGFFVYEQVGAAMVPLSFSTGGFAPGTSSKRDGSNEYCTGHYGEVSADGSAYTVPWYIAGIYVYDLTIPNAPMQVAHAIFPDSNVWSAKTYKGNYVFAGDLQRGFDVYRYTGELDLSTVTAGDEG